MFKKVVFVFSFILLFSLVFFKTEQASFLKEELDYSGIIFSDENELELKEDYFNLLLVDNDSEKMALIDQTFIVSEKEVLETYLNELSCDNAVVLAEFSFTNLDFFDKGIVNNLLKTKTDCPLCLYGVYYFSKKCGKEKYVFQDRNIYFKKEGEEINSQNQILFVGDMMFDRGVEFLSEKKGFNYPFEEIGNYLKKVKTLVGNLEGPIVNNPIFISAHSMSFSFNKEIAQVLKENNFSLISLANNHTFNMEKEGLLETKNFLKEKGIDFAGDPYTCSFEDVVVKEGVVYYAVNTTFPFNCKKEEIISIVKKIKETYPEEFLIVLMHWGEEYVHVASVGQQELAHAIIDAGGDLIIGGHAHVLQNIEKYKDKLIFYSLGNFIFDQYFSEETQQGLMVGLELEPEKQTYYLFPVEEKQAQPKLIENPGIILGWLASLSSSEIEAEIKEGKIVIY